MGVPYPSEVLGPPLNAFWAAHGEEIVLPLLAWAFVGFLVCCAALVIMAVYLMIKHDIPFSPAQAMLEQRQRVYEEMKRMSAASKKAPGQ